MPIDEPQAMPVRPRVRSHGQTSFSPANDYAGRGDLGDLDDPADMERPYSAKQRPRNQRFHDDDPADVDVEPRAAPVKASPGIIGSITQTPITTAIIIVLVVALLVAVAFIVRNIAKKPDGAGGPAYRQPAASPDTTQGGNACPAPTNQSGKPRAAAATPSGNASPTTANNKGDSSGKDSDSDVYARADQPKAPPSAPAPIPKASLDQLRRLHEAQTATPNTKTQAVVHNEDEISKLMNANSDVPTSGEQ